MRRLGFDHDELEQLLRIVERAQLHHDRPVRAHEILALLEPHERHWWPETPTGLTRRLQRFKGTPGFLGRALRVRKLGGHVIVSVYHDGFSLHHVPTKALLQQRSAIDSVLATRKDVEAAEDSILRDLDCPPRER